MCGTVMGQMRQGHTEWQGRNCALDPNPELGWGVTVSCTFTNVTLPSREDRVWKKGSAVGMTYSVVYATKANGFPTQESRNPLNSALYTLATTFISIS